MQPESKYTEMDPMLSKQDPLKPSTRTMVGITIDENSSRSFHDAEADIHTAVKNYDTEELRILLMDPDCDVNYLTSNEDSALHYAVESFANARQLGESQVPEADADQPTSSCQLSSSSQQSRDNEWEKKARKNIKLLLRHPKINLNIPNLQNFTPMQLAIHLCCPKAIEELLEHLGIVLDRFVDDHGNTCRKLITLLYPQFIEKMSRIPRRWTPAVASQDVKEFRFNSKRHDGKYTCLQYACIHGEVRVVEILLNAIEDPNQYCSYDRRTPLMIAAQNDQHSILLNLLAHPNISFEPVDEKTVLHSLFDGMKKGGYQAVVELKYMKCLVDLLNNKFRSKLDVNYADSEGNTPLYYALRLDNETAVKYLLRAGARIGRKNREGEVPLKLFSAEVLEEHFDKCVSIEDDHRLSLAHSITFNYTSIRPPENKDGDVHEDYINEMDVLLKMSEEPKFRKVLKHPVLSTFLNLKWRTVAKYFYLNLIFFSIFCLFLSIYIYCINDGGGSAFSDEDALFNHTHQSQNHSSDVNVSAGPKPSSPLIPTLATCSRIFTQFLNLCLIIREFYQCKMHPRSYFKFFENWLEICLCCVTQVLLVFSTQLSADLRRQLSAVTVMMSWVELMLLIGRHPAHSTYIEMFNRVCKNFLKFMILYSILLLAFAYSFFILFKDNAEEDNQFFRNLVSSVIKSIIMLTGEFDVGSIPLAPLDLTSIVSYLLFVSFVFLVTIVLFNLLNGLAVSDTQAIRADAEVVGIVSRIKLAAYIDATFRTDGRSKWSRLMDTVAKCCTLVVLVIRLKIKRYEHLRVLYQKACTKLPDFFTNDKIQILPNVGNLVWQNNFNDLLHVVKETKISYFFQIDSHTMRETVRILEKIDNARLSSRNYWQNVNPD